jgi:putative endonuclease
LHSRPDRKSLLILGGLFYLFQVMFYCYIIHSETHNKYYKGFTENPDKRLQQHNNGESRFTKNFIPWKLVFLQSFENKADALKREKVLKKYSHAQILQLIHSSLNEL